jgi:hypothetical protein
MQKLKKEIQLKLWSIKKSSHMCHIAQIYLINEKGGNPHPTLRIVGLTCLDSLRCNTILPKQISLTTPIKATNYRGCQFLLCTRLVHESIVLVINSCHHSWSPRPLQFLILQMFLHRFPMRLIFLFSFYDEKETSPTQDHFVYPLLLGKSWIRVKRPFHTNRVIPHLCQQADLKELFAPKEIRTLDLMDYHITKIKPLPLEPTPWGS